MLEKWIKGIQHYPSDKINDAILYECNRIFGDRLINPDHMNEYLRFVQKSFKSLMINEFQYFIPSGAKSSQLQFNSNDQWKEIITRTLSIASAYNFYNVILLKK